MPTSTLRRWRAGSSALVAVTLALGVSACGSGDTGDTATPTAQVDASRTDQAREAALADAGEPVDAPTDKTIGFMLLSASTEATIRMRDALQQAADLFGFDVITCDPNFDPAKTAQCMTTLVAQSPDLILLSAAATSALGGGLQTAAEQGIPVIMVGAEQAPSQYYTAQYVPDEASITETFDDWLFGEIEDRVGESPATVAAFQAPQVGPGVVARDTQRTADLENYPNLTQVTHDIDLADAVQDTLSQTQTFVQQNPDLQGIWQTCDFCGAANAQALDQLSLTGDQRPVTGVFYSPEQTREQIAAGKIDGGVEINWGAMSYVALDQALEHWARGTDFAADNSVFTDGYGIQMLEPWIVTADNVGDTAVVRNQAEDYITYFQTKWNQEFGVGTAGD